MADAFTQFLNLTKPEIGASRDAWGEKLNGNSDTLDVWAKATDLLAKAAVSKSATDAQALSGPLAVTPYLDIVRSGALRARWRVAENGLVVLSNGDNGDELFRVNPNDGAVWIKQLGDLNNRIETRANDFATARANSAQGAASSYTNTQLEAIRTQLWQRTADLQIAKSLPSLILSPPDGIGWKVFAAGDNYLHFRNQGANDDYFRIGPDGSLWTSQFGDLNQRIESRANTYATARANDIGNARVVAVALQGSWAKSTAVGQTSGDHPGVMTGIGIGSNGVVTNITGRFIYFNTPNMGWVGASSL